VREVLSPTTRSRATSRNFTGGHGFKRNHGGGLHWLSCGHEAQAFQLSGRHHAAKCGFDDCDTGKVRNVFHFEVFGAGQTRRAGGGLIAAADTFFDAADELLGPCPVGLIEIGDGNPCLVVAGTRSKEEKCRRAEALNLACREVIELDRGSPVAVGTDKMRNRCCGVTRSRRNPLPTHC